MRLILRWKPILQKLSPALVNELEQILERANSWAYVEHDGGGLHTDISVSSLTYRGATETTVGAAGGASALPATPTGYVPIVLSDGTTVQIPYYTQA